MTPEEYQANLKAIDARAEKEKRQMDRKYALSNNTVEIGDLIKDNAGWIKVETIEVYRGFSSKLPMCAYKGTEYTKAGKPFKRNSKRTIYQNNIIKKEGNKNA